MLSDDGLGYVHAICKFELSSLHFNVLSEIYKFLKFVLFDMQLQL